VALCGGVPAGGLSLSALRDVLVLFGSVMVSLALERERGEGESLGPACGLMTATPLGVVYLFEGVILPPCSLLFSKLSE
jgi:hypothetical protein